MKTPKFSVALQLFVVFVSGVLVGGLGYRFYDLRTQPAPMAPRMPPAGPGRGLSFRDMYVRELRERLSLTDEQVQRLNAILDTTGHKFFEARKRSDMEVRSLQEDQQAQIRAMLSPVQVAEFNKMLEERLEQMRRDWEKGHRPRP